MPRYIDADLLDEEIDKLQDSLSTNNDALWRRNKPIFKALAYTRGMIREEVPTADVVPRSEVARELKAFAEKVGRIYNHYVFEDTDYAEDDVAIEAVINALTEVLNDLSDLCQKYEEGEK